MAISDVDQTALPTELQNDKTNKSQFSEIAKHIYDQLVQDKQTGQPQQTSFDQRTANKYLQDNKLLPGLTITGIDQTIDKNGTGLQITDTKSGAHYTLDPDTGIAKSDNGTIAAIYYPDGKVQSFEYDGDKLTAVHDADGNVWKIGKDGTAQEFSRDGTLLGQTDGKFSMDDKGVITITNAQSTEVHKPDGSMVQTDNTSGKVTDIQFGFDKSSGKPRGTMHFDYEGDKLTGVTDQDGQKWVNVEGKWQTTKDGKTITSTAADFNVTAQGGVLITNADKSTEQYFPDGSKLKQIPLQNGKSGSTSILIDRNNQVTSIQSPGSADRNISWDSGKPVAVDVPQGQWTQDQTGHWTLRNKGGNEIGTANNLKVTADGAIVILNSDNSQDVIAPDGRVTHTPGPSS